MGPSPRNALDRRLQEFIRYSELKQLVYNIVALQEEKRFHSIAVISFFPGEGKTLFCAALAMAYAETCRSKVLIVDTATFQNKRSLALKDCFNGSASLVDVTPLEDLRKNSKAFTPPSNSQIQSEKGPVLDVEVVTVRPIKMSMTLEHDFTLIKKVSEEHSPHYGLVLFDTSAVHAKNRNNVDPLLVARLSGASVLVASRRLLDAPNLNASLKVLKDPLLHLLGVISNEGAGR
jgi:Mrp family chromosome partitioning ATPase